MTEAIFGLLGVIIGALISGVTNYALEKRKERMAARVAARLVRDDIYLVPVLIEDIVGTASPNHEILEKMAKRIGTQAWLDQRVHLAAAMEYDEFAAAGLAVKAADEFKYWFDSSMKAGQLADEERRYLIKIVENQRPGLEILKKYAG